MIKKDYIIEAQTDCDPTTEKCFVAHCDPTTDTTCTGDEEKDTSYYKKAQRVAANIPLCDPADEACKPFECSQDEKDCTVTLCDETTKGKDDECSDPEQYNIDHPATDEAAVGDGTTCDPEQDPTCVDGAAAGDGSDPADVTVTDGDATDNADAAAN